MDELSPTQLKALRNLARKQAGEEVDWISIADARALTELGLADRNPGGWHISPAGAEVLAGLGPEQRDSAPETLHRKPGADD